MPGATGCSSIWAGCATAAAWSSSTTASSSPAKRWDDRIQSELREADIVIVLISPDFVGSAYCGLEELLVTTERVKRGQTVVVPILCDHVDLGALPIAQVQCLPQDEQNDLKPLVDWPNFNVPLAAIAGKIRGLVQNLEAARPSRGRQGAGSRRPT